MEFWFCSKQKKKKETVSRANNATGRARIIPSWFVEQNSMFNRISRGNSVTSGSRNASKACIVQKFSIAPLAPIS